MEIKLGYTPKQTSNGEKNQFGDGDVEDFFKDVSCDYDRFYFKHYIGHYQNLWGHGSYSVTDYPAISKVLTSKGMDKLKGFLKRRYDHPIKVIWDYVIGEAGSFQKVVASLEEENNKLYLKVNIKSNNGVTEKVPIDEFKAFCRKQYEETGVRFNFSSEMQKELSMVCNHLGYDLTQKKLGRINKDFSRSIRGNDAQQISLSKDKKSVFIFLWRKWGASDFVVNEIRLPMNKVTFEQEASNQYIRTMYEEVISFLTPLLPRSEWFLSSEQKSQFIDHYLSEPSSKDEQKMEPTKVKNYIPVEVNVYTFTFDEVPIDEDIHLFKQIGVSVPFAAQREMSDIELKPNRGFAVIPLTSKANEELCVLPNEVYVRSKTGVGREIENLPNVVLKKRYTVDAIFEAKTKILLVLRESNSGSEHLFLLDKASGKLISRRF